MENNIAEIRKKMLGFVVITGDWQHGEQAWVIYDKCYCSKFNVKAVYKIVI